MYKISVTLINVITVLPLKAAALLMRFLMFFENFNVFRLKKAKVIGTSLV